MLRGGSRPVSSTLHPTANTDSALLGMGLSVLPAVIENGVAQSERPKPREEVAEIGERLGLEGERKGRVL